MKDDVLLVPKDAIDSEMIRKYKRWEINAE